MRGRKGKGEGDRVRCMRYMYMCGVEKEDQGRERESDERGQEREG